MCVQGKETTEEEDEVAVGMEKGFMDEFFEQVCFSPSPDPSFSFFFAVNHFFPIYTLAGSLKANNLSVQVICYSTTCPGVFPLLILNLIVLVFWSAVINLMPFVFSGVRFYDL